MSESVERWVAFAAEDLHAAKILFAEGVWNQACFHAQQCVEKALKGLIVRLGKGAPHEHTPWLSFWGNCLRNGSEKFE